jgi:hypothetical protein
MTTIPFRSATPVRRLGRSALIHYTSYRKTLKEDFNNRCGYCGSFDKIFRRSFAIDHFIPQNPTGFTHTLPANDYYNLVYACGYCNSAKTNKWPTNDPAKPNDGKKGFIDPVDPAYDLLFHRDQHGAIGVIKKTNHLSVYIHKELSLSNHIHSILWKLEKVDTSISTIKDLINKQGRTDLQQTLNEFYEAYHSLTSTLFA